MPSYENTAIIKLNERVISNTENPVPPKNSQGPQLKKLASTYIGLDEKYEEKLQKFEKSIKPNNIVKESIIQDVSNNQFRSKSAIIKVRQTRDFKDFDRPTNYYEPRSVTDELKVKLYFNREKRHKPLLSMDAFELFSNFIEAPFMWILYLTVLPCDKEQYSKSRCLMYPIPGMIFLTWTVLQEASFKVLFIGLGLGLLLLIAFSLTLEEEAPSWDIFIYMIGMIGGLAWTYILVNLLIDLLECTAIIFNLNKTFMGITILAVGSSMPDAITTITLCKNSESIMAISGAYSGQFFALTIAFGLAMLKLTLKNGP